MLLKPSPLVKDLHGSCKSVTARRHRGQIVIQQGPVNSPPTPTPLQTTEHFREGDGWSGGSGAPLYSLAPNYDMASSQQLRVSYQVAAPPAIWHSVHKWNFALAHPLVASVDVATITLQLLTRTVGANPDLRFQAAQLRNDWTAGQHYNKPADPGDVTWNHRVYNTQAWGTPGATNLTTDVHDYFYSEPPPAALGPLTFDAIQPVANWLLNGHTNAGILLRINDLPTTCILYWASSRHTTIAYRPQLSVTYSYWPDP